MSSSDSVLDTSNPDIKLSDPIAASTPIPGSLKVSPPASGMAPQGEDLETILIRVLDQRLAQQKREIVEDLTTVFNREIEELKGRLFESENANQALEARVAKLEAALERQGDAKTHAVLNDQYARRTHMVIYGLPEADRESPAELVASTIKDRLKLNISKSDLDVAHRLGAPSPRKTRAMVVVFKFRDKKYEVMRVRKNLKGSGITFIEDLCPEMRKLFETVKNHRNVASAWTWNGKIFAKDMSNVTHTIKYGSTWQELFKERASGENDNLETRTKE